MGMKEDVLALADDVESTIGGCYGCLLYKRGLCKAETDFDCNDEVCKFVAHRLRAIAEKDADDMTTVSAYDLLPDEDRKAVAWVREHGGIAEVKDEWKRRNNLKRRLEKAQDKVGRQQRHIEELQRKLAERRDGINAMRSQMAEMSKRLMPEGMEWPKYTDGALVEIGDEVVGPDYGERINIDAVKFHANGFTLYDKNSFDKWYEDDDRFERSAPKVVDADGVEIHAGDVLYGIETGDPVTVDSIEPGNPWFATTDGTLQHCAKFTHRAPVLAADGKPLKEGDTVYEAGSSCPDGMAVEDIDGGMVGCRLERYGLTSWPMFKPDQLTHEQPDDWSRWREDLELSPVEYVDRYRVGRFGYEELDTYRDLVRRAKKLAEKEPR